ncbi:DUF7146 domain-containing protein [Phaeobacter marinintestinus]|uniref:DUF7146 domain-containing protein n=1 Tax=Falsiphaeobacter marinintestinus TaxID=1492905 RepID=UPI001FEC2EC7|nr:toprim domain-containing protein [Phaeobacter marinintestinus]
MLLWCFKGCDFVDVLEALKAEGAVPGISSSSTPSVQDIARLKSEESARAQKRALQARTSWAEALPVGGTLAEIYLQSRGITTALPASLRFHPNCWHPKAQRYPALVARVDGCDHFAVHRTYLAADGSGKADVMPNKAMLGSVRGGAVRLASGTGPLVVCEGIETGLSLVQALADRNTSVWAALSTSGMSALRLPSVPARLTIAPDGDDAGRKAADTLARQADTLGWSVSIMPAPDGRDFNDILMEKQSA